MSLEAIIQENTNAIRELITALQVGVPTTTSHVAATKETTAKRTTPAEKAEPAATQHTTPEAPENKAETPWRASPPTYQDTADAVTKLARAKGREAAVDVLKEVNAQKLPEVDPSDFQKVIDLVNAALGA